MSHVISWVSYFGNHYILVYIYIYRLGGQIQIAHIDENYVKTNLVELVKDTDLSKFIL